MRKRIGVSLAAAITIASAAALLMPSGAEPHNGAQMFAANAEAVSQGRQVDSLSTLAKALNTHQAVRGNRRSDTQSGGAKKKAKCYPPYETKKCPLKPFTK